MIKPGTVKEWLNQHGTHPMRVIGPVMDHGCLIVIRMCHLCPAERFPLCISHKDPTEPLGYDT